MGLLLLLTSTLLFSYFNPGRVVDAQRSFAIRDISLSIEPSTDVTRDTNVTLRCQAEVSSSGQETLSREYTIYKDSSTVYTKTSSTSEDFLYPLPEVRVSNAGKYKCKISIDGKHMNSTAKKLTVTGLSKAVLHLNKGVVSEGEEITARCTAPGETGSIFFYFYEDSKEIQEKQVVSNQAQVTLRFRSVGTHKIHCAYTVLVTPDSFKSEESNTVTVSVKELPITAVLEIFPKSKVYEGDQLDIFCTVSNMLHSYDSIHLYLSQGNQLLSSGVTKVNHSMIALAKDPGEFDCRLEMGNVVKFDSKTVSVTELFSVPTLTMSPAEVFQNGRMTLTCKSESSASERLGKEELTYTLDPPETPLYRKGVGVFSGNALQYEFNYTCVAQAKGIVKHSEMLTVRPKVAVSPPKISVVERAILGQPFTILCKSDFGSPPINYTLWKGYEQVSSIIVEHLSQKAHFTAVVTKPEEISKYMCEAQNHPGAAPLSKRLNANVTVPVSLPILTVIPTLSEISEEDDLYLICGVKGTPPITFKWYRVDNEQPLYINTTDSTTMTHVVPRLSKEDSGMYYCEALNRANNVVRSDRVTIEVRLALWKKVVSGGFSLLVASALVVLCILGVYCVKSKRGKREAAAELSVKPSSPKSDDSLTVTLTNDTEVYNAATVRVDRAAVSVWSERPPEAGNDEESSVVTNEPDVEYTEVVHPRPVDPARVPLKKGTDTVYSELQNSSHGAADLHDYVSNYLHSHTHHLLAPNYHDTSGPFFCSPGSVEYAELNSEQPEINHQRPEVSNHQDLPVPVD